MPVWVRVAIRRPGGSGEVEASAKVNTGFTIGPLPFIRLPRALAERLGFDVEGAPPLPGIADAAGRSLPVRRLGPVEVRVAVPDREAAWVRAIAIYTGAPSVLLNDVLTEELKIVPERPASGLWRFSDEGLGELRRSAEPEYYR